MDNLENINEADLFINIDRMSHLVTNIYGFGIQEEKDKIEASKLVTFFDEMKEHPDELFNIGKPKQSSNTAKSRRISEGIKHVIQDFMEPSTTEILRNFFGICIGDFNSLFSVCRILSEKSYYKEI